MLREYGGQLFFCLLENKFKNFAGKFYLGEGNSSIQIFCLGGNRIFRLQRGEFPPLSRSCMPIGIPPLPTYDSTVCVCTFRRLLLPRRLLLCPAAAARRRHDAQPCSRRRDDGRRRRQGPHLEEEDEEESAHIISPNILCFL